MQILLVTPPLTQLNAPYPASPYLAGYLALCGHQVEQLDLGILLVDRIFTRSFLNSLFDEVAQADVQTGTKGQDRKNNIVLDNATRRMVACRERYESTVEPVMRFLRGLEPTLASRIASRQYLPEGQRFEAFQPADQATTGMATHDLALQLATLFLEELSDFIRNTVAPHFELIRYGEKICQYLPELDPLIHELERQPLNRVDQLMRSILEEHLQAAQSDVVGFCVPFPGNLYGAMSCSRYLRHHHPSILTVMGGGYVNTELRQLSDPRLFDYLDFLLFDDGELPLQRLLDGFAACNGSKTLLKQSAISGGLPTGPLIRTKYCVQQEIISLEMDSTLNIPVGERGTPDYSGLPLSSYLDLMGIDNPMLRLWSRGRWNKITLAHGCYWAKCAFCDTSLDYIARFERLPASTLVDQMEAIIRQTGQSGFHFVDEAAPPALLKKVAVEILRRGLQLTWWCNIRFERAFTPDLCRLLARSGCVAVSGGIEVASDRLLSLMNKGVTLFGAANACQSFQSAGIMVHAYLMYGFPSQTTQETMDSLEVVRQFFSLGLIQSAFWHRFAMTAHSPVGQHPEQYGVRRVRRQPNPFSNNEVPFDDPSGIDHDLFARGLRTATYNWMHGAGLDEPVSRWFETRMPKPTHPPAMVESLLVTRREQEFEKHHLLLWLGDGVQHITRKSRDGRSEEVLTAFWSAQQQELVSDPRQTSFALKITSAARPTGQPLTFDEAGDLFASLTGMHAGKMVKSAAWKWLCKSGLVVV